MKLAADEEKELYLVSVSVSGEPVVSFKRYSTFTRVQRVVAWILCFINRCRASTRVTSATENFCLTIPELVLAERYLVRFSQAVHFSDEITSLIAGNRLHCGSRLLLLHPFVDSCGVLCIGGRECQSKLSCFQMHPIILHGMHPLSRLIIHSEQLRLLHAGPTLVFFALSQHFHILGMRKTIHSIVH